MKKVHFWLVLLGILCLLASTSCAEVSRVYRNEEFNLAFSVPDEWVYDDSGEVELFRLAANGDKSEAFVMIAAQDAWNLLEPSLGALGYTRADVNMDMISKDIFAKQLEVKENLIHTIRLGEYDYYKVYTNGALAYMNADNGYMYEFMYFGVNSYIEEVENAIKTVIHDAKGQPDSVQEVSISVAEKQKLDSTNSWVYKDDNGHCTFRIPNTWVMKDRKSTWEHIKDMFVLAEDGKKSFSSLTYMSLDVWSALLSEEGAEEELKGISRDDVGNALLTSDFIEEAYGIGKDEMDIADLGDYTYYKAEVSGAKTYICVDRGYMYMFCYYGEEEYIDEVEDVIKTVQFN